MLLKTILVQPLLSRPLKISGQQISLSRTATVTVTAEDGSTGTYSIIFEYRPLRTEARLDSMTCSAGSLSPAFSPDIFNYTCELDPGTGFTPSILAIPVDSNAIVSVASATDVDSPSDAERTTTVIVTAEDKVHTEVYRILFNVSTTGITDSQDDGLSIWPVPASEELHIRSDAEFSRVVICDLHGRMVMINDTGLTRETMLRLSGLERGIYFIRLLRDDDIIYTRKVVRE